MMLAPTLAALSPLHAILLQGNGLTGAESMAHRFLQSIFLDAAH
jgi:hypothetical protein